MPDDAVDVAVRTFNEGKQAIVFAETKASAEKTAELISKKLPVSENELAQKALNILTVPTKQCKRLHSIIQKGAAFHHSGLASKQRELIEEEFRKGRIRIICSTPTLAAGLDLPAFRVIIKSLKRFSGGWGRVWLPVLEIHQMEGRAGRPSYDKHGEAILISKTADEKEKIRDRYIHGVPEDITSKLGVEPILRRILLGLISTGIINSKEKMENFFLDTLWAIQYKDMGKLAYMLSRVLNELIEWGFVNKNIVPTVLGRRVSELYLDPYTAHHFIKCMNERTPNTFSILQMVCHSIEMRPLPHVRKKEEESVITAIIENFETLLEDEPPVFDIEYGEYKSSIKTAMIIEAWCDEKHEDYILEEYNIRPGELSIKLNNADWLLFGAFEIARIIGYEHAREIAKVRSRVKYGIKEELLALIKVKGIGRIRARKLYNNNVTGIAALKRCTRDKLTAIVGKGIAEQIKKQF